MNDISKSIWVGTVDFFGILIPGVLIIVTCIVGFVVPIGTVIVDLSKMELPPLNVDTNIVLLILFLLIVFSYVFGYILRLSSPDKLDRKSAIKVIIGECTKNTWQAGLLTIRERFNNKDAREIMKQRIKADAWPFDPDNPTDKYPYLSFRKYLVKRGHKQLAENLVTWGLDDDNVDNNQRSKSIVNKMKLFIRLYCPELSMLIESKEAHIRLMAGTWAAFKFSQWPIWIALIIVVVVTFTPRWIESILPVEPAYHNYGFYIFTNLILLSVIFFCNQQIEKLFHYRRVNELFHIAQAAYFAEQKRDATVQKGKHRK